MGQKVNPHGLRVGVIKDWDSHWFVDKKDFAANIKEDNEIRNALKKKYYQAAISKIEIENNGVVVIRVKKEDGTLVKVVSNGMVDHKAVVGFDLTEEGINEKDIYYNWEEKCYVLKTIKKFYKNGPIKIHPNICPFEHLPMDDKNYDICFTLAMPFLREKSKPKKR